MKLQEIRSIFISAFTHSNQQVKQNNYDQIMDIIQNEPHAFVEMCCESIESQKVEGANKNLILIGLNSSLNPGNKEGAALSIWTRITEAERD